MSVVGFTSPSMKATNLLYNVVGTPGATLRYMRENRMFWPLGLAITIGTLPGVPVGYYVRVRFWPDPRAFKLFVGMVLLYIGFRAIRKVLRKGEEGAVRQNDAFAVSNVTYSLTRMGFDFQAHEWSSA